MEEHNISLGTFLDDFVKQSLANQEVILSQLRLIQNQLNSMQHQPNDVSQMHESVIMAHSPVQLESPSPLVDGEVLYAETMFCDDDGLPCFHNNDLKKSSSFYKLVINGGNACVYVTDDSALQFKMLDNYSDYILFGCVTENESRAGCKIQTVSPGKYELNDEQWREVVPIKIKFI